MKRPHYWRKSRCSASPSEVLVVDTESWHGELARVSGGELQTLRLGCAMAYRLDKGKRTRLAELEFTEQGSFWEFAESRLSPHRTLWIVGHNLAYDLGILHGWKWLLSAQVVISQAIIEDGILLIRGQHNGREFVMGDTFNWYKCSLDAIGIANGLPKLEMPTQGESNHRWWEYCWRDVRATAAGVDSLVTFLRENELGPFQPTIASQAFSIFRHRFMTHKVLVHTYAEPLALERSAYYGGLVETPLIGRRVEGPVTECDVVSMYPGVCLNDLPTRIVGHAIDVRPGELKQRLRDGVCIADVTLRAEGMTYPVRRRHNVYQCRGTLRTALADAELRRAVEEGSVTAVHRLLWYAKEPLFRDYMTYFAEQKTRFRKEGNTAWEMIAKFAMNSLYGKTGQLTPRWIDWGEYALALLESENDLQPGTLTRRAEDPPLMTTPEQTVILHGCPVPIHCRQLFGEVQIQVGRTESRDSVPAIAACVTSSARVQLQRYHRTAGDGNWFYSDTDSVWVNASGLESLDRAGDIKPGSIGFLEPKRVVSWLRVHGRKDYEFTDGSKTKGRKRNAVDITPDEYRRSVTGQADDIADAELSDGRAFRQSHFPTAKSQLSDGPWGAVFVRYAVKRLRRVVDWCVLQPDGRTTHYRLPDDEPSIGKNTRSGCNV